MLARMFCLHVGDQITAVTRCVITKVALCPHSQVCIHVIPQTIAFSKSFATRVHRTMESRFTVFVLHVAVECSRFEATNLTFLNLLDRMLFFNVALYI